jgi:hypothetical protein
VRPAKNPAPSDIRNLRHFGDRRITRIVPMAGRPAAREIAKARPLTANGKERGLHFISILGGTQPHPTSQSAHGCCRATTVAHDPATRRTRPTSHLRPAGTKASSFRRFYLFVYLFAVTNRVSMRKASQEVR